MFSNENDYLAFERVLIEAHQRCHPLPLLDWCLMPNHWHLVVASRTTMTSSPNFFGG